MRQVAIRVAMVIPEIGLEEHPMIPTIREETVTKKKPKTTIKTAINKLPGNRPGICGRTDISKASPMEPSKTKVIGMSRSVRLRESPAVCWRLSERSTKLSRKELIIVGTERRSVMTPEQATAPAPI